MGTNYYWYKNQPCPTCGHEDQDRKHIGKSSAGWCFTLHVEPDNGICDLDDWKGLFETPGSYIRDEYGQTVSVAEMLSEITARGREERWHEKPMGYLSWRDFHSTNHSERGPQGLLRHQLNWSCIKHGEGTWDCCIGEFC